MSANNVMYIQEKKGRFTIQELDYDTGLPTGGFGKRKAKTLREAVEIANDWQNGAGFPEEYGLQIDLEKRGIMR